MPGLAVISYISFSIATDEEGLLEIFDVKGRLVESEKFGSGVHKYTWDASDNASGVYFYKLQSMSYAETKKMILIK